MLLSGLLDRQLAGDVSHKPSTRLPLLSAWPAVTFPSPERQRHCPVGLSAYTAWWTEARVRTTCL